MTGRICAFEGCGRPHVARGYCGGHWRQHRNGGPLRPIHPLTLTRAERFELHVDRSGDCHLWTGATNKDGYGSLNVGNHKTDLAHRVAWVMAHGPIPPGMEVDHKCWVPACVNPAHLRMATRKQNMENRAGAQSNSALGVRGVIADGRRFRAYLTHNKRRINLGTFPTLEEADAAVRAKRAELFTHSAEADGRVAV